MRRSWGFYVALVVAALLAMGQDSCDTESGGGSDGGGEFNLTRATDSQVRQLVEDKLGAEVEGGGARVRSVDCSRGTCFVEYTADEPVLDPEREILEEQRPIWKELFDDPQLRRATLKPFGGTVSTGGKESVDAVMEVTCDRAANRQIDWANVDDEGIRTLCDYTALVNFD